MACGLCQDLRRPVPDETVIVSCDHSDLIDAAAHCDICKVLASVVQDAKPNTVDGISLTLENQGYFLLKITTKTNSNRPLVLDIHFLPLQDLKPEAIDELKANSRDRAAGRRSPYTDSESSLEWVQARIARCKDHPQCQPLDSACLPDRVLSIGETNDDVRLYVSDGENEAYVTLSHCWGGHLPIMLNKANLASFQEGISFDALPKTFQDAVVYTRRLGFRYLWIDSLCIVQDDAEDWRQQSAKMAGIYEHSSINLAATVAFDGRDGLFTPHRPSLAGYITDGTTHVPIDSVTVETLESEQGKPGRFVVKEWISAKHPGYFFQGGPDVADTLAGRAWVYQERLLCSKVLHFGHSDLFWECNAEVACQCGAWRHTLSRHLYAQFPKDMHTRTARILSEGDTKVLRYRWQRIVTEFSCMAIMFESDRLPAVAGVAKQLSSRCPDGLQYVMGVWKEFLFLHLLWHVPPWEVKPGGERWLHPRPPDALERAMPPSWTWASVGNCVQYEMEDPGRDVSSFEKDTPRDPRIVEVPWAEDEADRLLGRATGELVIHGHLTKTRLLRYRTTEETMYGVSHFDGVQFYQIRLDTSPEDDSRWTTVDPGWQEPPEQNHDRFVSYQWWVKEPMSLKDRLLLDWQVSPLKSMRDKFESCEEFDAPAWCLFIRRWDGSVAYDISLVLVRVSKRPERFARIGVLFCPPERLPIYAEGDIVMREVALV